MRAAGTVKLAPRDKGGHKKTPFQAGFTRPFWTVPLAGARAAMTMDMLKAPEIERHWALFLDLDGTLLDIAPAPDKVIIPPGLIDALARVGAALNGALAVVSGRRLADIDRMLSPLRVHVAAEHGAVVRLPSGVVDSVSPVHRPPPQWMEQLREATRNWDGILVEEKTYSIAIHYRLAPNRMSAVKELATSLVRSDPQFELLVAKEAFEVRPKGVTKGRAVEMLVETEPFRARQPVFVGDDVTDEDGMEIAARLGGFGLNVGAVFGGKPPAVREWLNRAADSLT